MYITRLAVVAALAAVGTAQSLSSLPSCAQQCVGNSLASTGCNIIDIACICKSSGWIAGLSCCISKGCSAADQATTIQFADQICQVADVTLPSVASCASGAASTGTPTSTPSATPSATGSSTGESSTGAVVASMSGTMTMATGSTVATATMTSVTPAVSGTTTVPASTTATPSTAGAAHLVQQGMGIAGAAVAAFAFL